VNIRGIVFVNAVTFCAVVANIIFVIHLPQLCFICEYFTCMLLIKTTSLLAVFKHCPCVLHATQLIYEDFGDKHASLWLVAAKLCYLWLFCSAVGLTVCWLNVLHYASASGTNIYTTVVVVS